MRKWDSFEVYSFGYEWSTGRLVPHWSWIRASKWRISLEEFESSYPWLEHRSALFKVWNTKLWTKWKYGIMSWKIRQFDGLFCYCFQARNALLVRWSFKFWRKSAEQQKEVRLQQQETADQFYKKTIMREAWVVWLRSYRVEEWARWRRVC